MILKTSNIDNVTSDVHYITHWDCTVIECYNSTLSLTHYVKQYHSKPLVPCKPRLTFEQLAF